LDTKTPYDATPDDRTLPRPTNLNPLYTFLGAALIGIGLSACGAAPLAQAARQAATWPSIIEWRDLSYANVPWDRVREEMEDGRKRGISITGVGIICFERVEE
jgi:hypothetical protein